MRQMVVLSGKGGTGKTTVTAALAHLASADHALVLVDADVDAANLELVLPHEEKERHEFRSGHAAVIDRAMCTTCGKCAEVCRFDAVVSGWDGYRVDPVACEGCAACFYQCPAGAIRLEEQTAGEWRRSDTGYGPLFHAHLFAGQENSGKLVTLVRQQGRLLAERQKAAFTIIDGPPGIGCPVIAAATGVDLALLVTEPTISGVHDLERALRTTEHFGVPALVVVNKADLNPQRVDEIVAFCGRHEIEVGAYIPFDPAVTEAIVAGQPVTAYAPSGEVSLSLRSLWQRLRAILQ